MRLFAARLARLAVVPAALSIAAAPAVAELQVLEAFYRPDRARAEFNYLWNSGYAPGSVPPNYTLSGALCIYLINTGPSAVTVTDVTLQNISLTDAFGCKTNKTYRDGLAYACSIHIPSNNPISSAQRQALIDAGEPIWWRADPDTIGPGATAEVFVRMRVKRPQTLSLSVQHTSGSIPVSITVGDIDPPRVAGYALSPGLTKLYLYFRHPQKGKAPEQVFLDGQDITASCSIGSDPDIDVTPVVYPLPAPLAAGSFHTFRAGYDDGSKAVAGARVYAQGMFYGIWGGNNAASLQSARAHVEDMGVHNLNLQVLGATGMVNDFMKSTEGLALLDQLGIWRMHNDPDKAFGRLNTLFLCDEPDAGDAAVPVTAVPSYAQLGSLAQSLVVRGDSYRSSYPTVPNCLNLDSTFKPHNWYVYGQVADMFSADPYYQTRQADSFWTKPHQIPLYAKATYIYGVASVCQAACEPKPLHLILSCTRRQDGTRMWRWGTPEEKRIEVYYALAAGVKQFSYWWFTPIAPDASGSSGVGRNEPPARALWREMGLLAAEVRTGGPVIVQSAPADVPVRAPGNIWTRVLLKGLDTLVLLCVNDDYANDRSGTAIRPVANAQISLDLPAWMTAAQVFEVDYKGVRDVEHSLSSGNLSLSLGTLDVTRMIVITGDSSLKADLSALYASKFAANVSQLIPAQ